MRHQLIQEAEKQFLKEDLPEVKVGDLVNVAVKIIENNKTRIQNFEGTVLSLKSTGLSRTMTVRKIASGVGVERVFLMHSPLIDIKVLGTNPFKKFRRAKLYYRRKLAGKAARVQYQERSSLK